MRTAVIIPAFNEADALPGVLADLATQVPDHQVVVVDDGSSDGTHLAAVAGLGNLRSAGNSHAAAAGGAVVEKTAACGRRPAHRVLPE